MSSLMTFQQTLEGLFHCVTFWLEGLQVVVLHEGLHPLDLGLVVADVVVEILEVKMEGDVDVGCGSGELSDVFEHYMLCLAPRQLRQGRPQDEA